MYLRDGNCLFIYLAIFFSLSSIRCVYPCHFISYFNSEAEILKIPCKMFSFFSWVKTFNATNKGIQTKNTATDRKYTNLQFLVINTNHRWFSWKDLCCYFFFSNFRLRIFRSFHLLYYTFGVLTM